MNNLDFAKKTVKRLILQYKEYEILNEEIKKFENEKFKLILKKDNKKIKELDKKINLLKLDLQQISDEMTFSNPIIWMMYKNEAYKNTSKEIETMRDFRKHCEPDGYICTNRFRFLNNYLNNVLEDKNIFPDDMLLINLYKQKIIVDLLDNPEFMKKWKDSEYLKTNNQINKWHTAI
ncbi:MAG TPA: hypothetical protein VG895_05005 [Patescibacteria group bacterium]|nr:hypothetical protein [Patescibacteria group bacterium]